MTAAQNDAAEVALRCERRLGEMSRELPAAPGPNERVPGPGRGRKNPPNVGQVSKSSSKTSTLAAHSITRQDAARFEQLAAVAVVDLATPAQHFRCQPYNATIRAATCLERQALHGRRYLLMPGGAIDFKRPARGSDNRSSAPVDLGRCGRCELGQQVQAQLRSETADPPTPATPPG